MGSAAAAAAAAAAALVRGPSWPSASRGVGTLRRRRPAAACVRRRLRPAHTTYSRHRRGPAGAAAAPPASSSGGVDKAGPEPAPEPEKDEGPARRNRRSARRWAARSAAPAVRLAANVVLVVIFWRAAGVIATLGGPRAEPAAQGTATPATAAAAGAPSVPKRTSVEAAANVPYSEFLRAVRRKDVATLTVDGTMLTWRQRQAPHSHLAAVRPADCAVPYEELLRQGTRFGAVDRRGVERLQSLSLALLWACVLLGFVGRLPGFGMRFPERSGAPGQQRIGRRDSKSGAPPEVTFADVAGVDEAKEELAEIVDYLRNPERYAKLGARPPTGVLLVGAPGCGKTLLAKAVAGEADVPFISVAASEFVELYVGMGASRVREVFARAKAQAPSIVFIDEIDAVAKGRSDGRMRGMGNDEREQTLNQLLTELDGFDTSSMVICLAATNRPDTLDSALRRPGRFDRIVSVERPDRQGREEILGVHVGNRGLPLAGDVSLAEVASATAGFTGAELANVVNEAALLAGRREKDEVFAADFNDAIFRSIAGIEKKRSLLGDTEKGVVSTHEAGHALVGTAVARIVGGSRVEQISIISRAGGALGFAYIPPSAEEERVLLFADELRGRLATLLGGRAAEELAVGRVSTGAVDDIQRATELAYRAVAEYGLSSRIGPLSVQALKAGGGEAPLIGESGSETSSLVEREVRFMLDEAVACARAVLEENRAVLDELAAVLSTKERVGGDELQSFLDRTVVPGALEDFVKRDTWARESGSGLEILSFDGPLPPSGDTKPPLSR